MTAGQPAGDRHEGSSSSISASVSGTIRGSTSSSDLIQRAPRAHLGHGRAQQVLRRLRNGTHGTAVPATPAAGPLPSGNSAVVRVDLAGAAGDDVVDNHENGGGEADQNGG
jgi:hypothetical protein